MSESNLPARITGDAPPRAGADAAGPPATRPESAGKSPAEWAHERLVFYIRNFEKQLDQGEEIAMGFVGSDAGVMRIEGIGWFAPDIIAFYGRDENGLRTQLIQHVSQLNVMLRAVPKLQANHPPRRIGFRLSSGWEEEDGPAAPDAPPVTVPPAPPDGQADG